MRFLVVGTGDAFSTEHFGSSCVIEAPKGHVLLDCPDLIGRALREAGTASGWHVSASGIDDIIVTHLHGDHCNGLESLGFKRWLMHRNQGSPLPRLHCWKPIADRLWERLAPAMDQGGKARLRDYFELHTLDPERESHVAGLAVRCRPTDHSVPTVALRLQSHGRTLAWSSDTPFDPDLIHWLQDGADLIVHETSPPPTHTPIEPLNALPAGVRERMRLIHMPDGFDPASTDIRCLRQGEVVQV
ncbi:MAG: MBL fold metallo-hydrolase [Planctomycetota bacterium]